MKLSTLITVILVFMVTDMLYAQTEHRQADAHVHGTALLTIMKESSTLLFVFETPAANIVGFEHAPQNDTQINQIENALQLLKSTDSVLLLSALDCAVAQTMSTATGQFSAHTHDEETTAAAEHVHGEHEHAEHAHAHAGFNVIIELDCQNQASLSGFTVTAFENFSGLETLQVQWVLDGSQGAQQLSRSQSQLRFR